LKVTLTTPAKGPPNLKPRAPPHARRGIHGKNKPVKATPTQGRRPMTGLCSYALAFSTLLSSQETDAHHQPAIAAHPGQPSYCTLRLPCCQIGVSGLLPGLHQLLGCLTPSVPKVRGTHAGA
jgi:hypothetical protein